MQRLSALRVFILVIVMLFMLLVILPVKGVTEKGRRWAIIVGINNYQKDVTPLHCAVNDAQEFKKALMASAGFDEDDIFLLTSDQTKGTRIPDRVNIVRWVTYITQNSKPDDTFVFFFSGHGMDMDKESYLLTVEAEPMSSATLEMSSLKVKDLMKFVDQMSAGKKLLFIDACRNDPRTGKGDATNAMTDNFSKNLKIKGSDTENYGDLLSATFYSCAVGERSYEWSQKSMGFFTYYLVKGIQGEARNDEGKVTVDSLKQYISQKVKSAVDREQGALQRPWVSLDGAAGEGSFALSKFDAPGKLQTQENSPSRETRIPAARPTPSASNPVSSSTVVSHTTPTQDSGNTTVPSVTDANRQQNYHPSLPALTQGGGNSAVTPRMDQGQLQSHLSSSDTELVRAIVTGDRSKVDKLLNGGKDVNKRLMNGQTALHFAAFMGKREIVQYLLEKGADINAKDGNGYTPLTAAKSSNHNDIVELLRKRGARD